ncbi:hypothetical protein Aduo_011417 [Ancylostoma duodenale]
MFIVIAAEAMHFSVDRYIINLLAGVFVTIATACNFFVYYAVSREYRNVFDEILHIKNLKKKLWRSGAASLSAVNPIG